MMYNSVPLGTCSILQVTCTGEEVSSNSITLSLSISVHRLSPEVPLPPHPDQRSQTGHSVAVYTLHTWTEMPLPDWITGCTAKPHLWWKRQWWKWSGSSSRTEEQQQLKWYQKGKFYWYKHKTDEVATAVSCLICSSLWWAVVCLRAFLRANKRVFVLYGCYFTKIMCAFVWAPHYSQLSVYGTRDLITCVDFCSPCVVLRWTLTPGHHVVLRWTLTPDHHVVLRWTLTPGHHD